LNYVEKIKFDLSQYSDLTKATFLQGFFQTAPGGYGEGDRFIGVIVPKQREIAKKYQQEIDLQEVELLLNDCIHEYRLTALFILVYKFAKAKNDQEKEKIVNLYLKNYNFINNWDLVDSSADKILGQFVLTKDKTILYEMASSGHLWKQRIAIIATFYFIKNKQFTDTLEIAKILLKHKHDLIHKAVGWMLREIGKRDFLVEFSFLKEHYQQMPRTMLRYAIEKFEPQLRKEFLKGII